VRLRALGRPVYAVWTRFADPRFAVTPRQGWSGFEGVPLPTTRPAWEGRYPILFADGTHVIAMLVPPRALERGGS
jgi:hypothetical protein